MIGVTTRPSPWPRQPLSRGTESRRALGFSQDPSKSSNCSWQPQSVWGSMAAQLVAGETRAAAYRQARRTSRHRPNKAHPTRRDTWGRQEGVGGEVACFQRVEGSLGRVYTRGGRVGTALAGLRKGSSVTPQGLLAMLENKPPQPQPQQSRAVIYTHPCC